MIGRYILTPDVMNNLGKVQKGSGGEIQLTDAIALEIEEDRPVHGLRFKGNRFDCGSKAGFLQATVSFALEREELHGEFANFLVDMMPLTQAAE